MKIWLLQPVEEYEDDIFTYDCAYGFVIRAESEEQARQIANANGGNESTDTDKKISHPWLDPEYSYCEILTAKGKAGIVLKITGRMDRFIANVCRKC